MWEAVRSRLRSRTDGYDPPAPAPLRAAPARVYDIVHCHFGDNGLTALTRA